jgi:hypothetical protein
MWLASRINGTLQIHTTSAKGAAMDDACLAAWQGYRLGEERLEWTSRQTTTCFAVKGILEHGLLDNGSARPPTASLELR